MTSSAAVIDDQAKRSFEFDGVPLANPPGTALPQIVCSQRLGGLCQKHECFSKADAVVKNIYQLLKARGIGREQLPAVCQLGDHGLLDLFEYCVVCDMHGAGENIIVVGFRPVGGNVLALSRGAASNLAITTLHRLASMRIGEGDKNVLFRCFDYIGGIHEHGLALILKEERFHQDVPVVRLKKQRKPAADIRLPFGITVAPGELRKSGGVPVDDAAEVASHSDSDASDAVSLAARDPSSSDVEEIDEGGPPLPPPVAPPPVVDPAPAPPADAPPAPARPKVGLCGFERAPSSRSSCFVCSGLIKEGEWRFNFQLRATRTLSDRKRVHAHCVHRLPDASREVDHLFCLARRAGQITLPKFMCC